MPWSLLAQTSEADLIKRADKLFEESSFVEATPLYLQLLSLNQSSPEYNYKYGTCLLYSDGDKSNGLKYLRYAAQHPGVPKQCFFYLGYAYHINYRFAEAIQAYQQFATLATSKEKEKFQVERQIEMCRNGQKLLRNITDIVVIDKREIGQDQFFRLYNLEGIGGQIYVMQELQTSLDKKNKHRILVHTAKNPDVVYYSSYGTDARSGKDLYRVIRQPNGGWGKPQLLKGAVNTPYDEDYPFMHPDGTTLYFCSKGHNSMGGYDLFKSTYDPLTDQFGTPENVDFAISSPDDDLLYIVDSLGRNAWFASARESRDGNIHVYHVRVERVPVMIAVLKGRFIAEIPPGNVSATITVEELATNATIGIFPTSAGTGSYVITLPKSGKYRFTVTPDQTGQPLSAIVDIPYRRELRPLKQEIRLVNRNGQDRLEIRNLFDEEVEDADELIASLMQERGKLTPNADRFELDTLDHDPISPEPDEPVLPVNLSNDELLRMVQEDAHTLEKEAEILSGRTEAAFTLSRRKTDEAREKTADAEVLLRSLDKIVDPTEQQQVMAAARALHEESETLLREATAAYEVARYLEQQHEKKKEEARVSREYANGIGEALRSSDHQQVIAKLKSQQEFIAGTMAAEKDRSNAVQEIRSQASQKQKAADAQLIYAQELRKDESTLNQRIDNLTRELNRTNKQERRRELEKDLARYTEELTNLRADIRETFRRQEQLQHEAEALLAKAEMMQTILQDPYELSPALSQSEKNALADQLSVSAQSVKQNEQRLVAGHEKQRDLRGEASAYLKEKETYRQLETQQRAAQAITDPQQRLLREQEIEHEWLRQLDSDISTLHTVAERETDPSVKRDLQQKIEGLQVLREEKQEEIQRKAQEIATQTPEKTNPPSTPELLPPLLLPSASTYQSEEAKVTQQAAQQKLAEVQQLEQQIATQQSAYAQETDTEARREMAAQLESDREKLRQSELALAEQAAEAIQMETKKQEAVIQTHKHNAAATLSQADKVRAATLEEEAIRLQEKAISDREKAAESASIADRRKWLNESLEAANEALQKTALVAEIYEAAASETPVVKVETNPENTDVVPDDLLPGYTTEWQRIESSSQNPIEKATAREALRSRLLEKIELEKTAPGSHSSPSRIALLDKMREELERDQESDRSVLLIARIDPDYLEDTEAIAASNESDLRKQYRQEVRNRELLLRIDQKLDALKKEDPSSPEIQALETWRNELLNATAPSRAILEQAGIVNTHSEEKAAYPEAEAYQHEQAQQEIRRVKPQAERLNAVHAEIVALKLQAAETSNQKEKKKIDKQIRSLEAERNTLEQNLATTLSKAETAERQATAQHIAALKTALEKEPRLSDPRLEKARELEQAAEAEFARAQVLRNEAARTRNTDQRHKLLAQANRAAQLGNTQLREAEALYRIMLDEFELNITDPESTAQLPKTTEPTAEISDEGMQDRISYRQAKEAESLAKRADKLEQEARQREDSAAVVRKKYRAILLDEAAALRAQAKEFRAHSVRLAAQAETARAREEAEIVAERRREEEAAVLREKADEVKHWAEYARYYDLKTEATTQREKAGALSEQAARQTATAEALHSEAAVERAAARYPEADDREARSLRAQRVADSLLLLSASAMQRSREAEQQAEAYLRSVETARAGDIRAVTAPDQQWAAPERRHYTAEEIARYAVVPDKIETEIFTRTEKTLYSDNNPIPVNPEMPSGIFFKVQVGAFRKPIPQDLFKEFAPVTGEQTPSGLTRYTVGYFTTFATANTAKNEIRQQGYSDAFVVAFHDGKRIQVYEAQALLAAAPPVTSTPAATVSTQPASVSPVAVSQPDAPAVNPGNVAVGNQATNFVPEPGAAAYYAAVPGAAPARQVEVITGLFYTVQVGVYSKPVSAAQLFNLSPLNSELTPNGLIRYTTGSYPDVQTAVSRKDEVREIGVKDAFVTAYFNGKRISLAAATDTLRKYGTSILTLRELSSQREPVPAVSPVPSSSGAPSQSPAHTQLFSSETAYKVIVGLYGRNLPEADAERIIASLQYGICRFTSGTSVVYFTGDYPSEQEAEEIRRQLISEGFAYAYVSRSLPGAPVGDTLAVAVPKTDTTIVFRVYLGEYEGSLPAREAEILLRHLESSVRTESTSRGTSLYYTEPGNSYAEALRLAALFRMEGIEEVRIAAFRQGIEVPSAQAFYSREISYTVVLGEYSGAVPMADKRVLESDQAIKPVKEILPGAQTVYRIKDITQFEQAREIKAHYTAAGLQGVRILALKDGKTVSLSDVIQFMYE